MSWGTGGPIYYVRNCNNSYEDWSQIQKRKGVSYFWSWNVTREQEQCSTSSQLKEIIKRNHCIIYPCECDLDDYTKCEQKPAWFMQSSSPFSFQTKLWQPLKNLTRRIFIFFNGFLENRTKRIFYGIAFYGTTNAYNDYLP